MGEAAAKAAMGNAGQETLREYLEGNDILIVDASLSSRETLADQLIRLGAREERLSLVGTLEDARIEIKRVRPKVFFCDFMVGKDSGLDLIQDQRREHVFSGANDLLCVLVTANGSQATVARAAEEDVDTFVLKPYSQETLKRCLIQAVLSKLQPNLYIQKIDQGKKHLTRGEIDQAITCFGEAMTMDPKPTLACFYFGQAEMTRKELEDAKAKFSQGLMYTKIHYKCLIGMYELLLRQGRDAEAYDVVKKIAQYFPANPKRLAAVLRLAIVTSNYDDIEGYFRIFTAIEQRTDELVKYICSAMSITGKYYLKKNTLSRALEVFDKVAESSTGQSQYLRYIVETLVQYERAGDASKFLKWFSSEHQEKPDYLVSELVVASATKVSKEVIQQGEALLVQGIHQPVVYRILIDHVSKAGQTERAHQLIRTAVKKWPEMTPEFESLLKKKESAAA